MDTAMSVIQMFKNKEHNVTAKLIGYQEDIDGPPFPLFNIHGGDRDGSTVTEETLRELGIEVPEIKEGL